MYTILYGNVNELLDGGGCHGKRCLCFVKTSTKYTLESD